MIVHMLYRLAGVFAAVVHNAVAAFRNAGDFSHLGAGAQAGGQLLIGEISIVRHIGGMLLADDQHMGLRLRRDIVEGIGELILIHLLGRDLASHDLAEQTIAHE